MASESIDDRRAELDRPSPEDARRNPLVFKGTIDDFPAEKGWLSVRKKPIIVHARQIGSPFVTHTLEGVVKNGRAGDYLMAGVRGELYPISREIFEETYDVMMEGLADPEDEGDDAEDGSRLVSDVKDQATDQIDRAVAALAGGIKLLKDASVLLSGAKPDFAVLFCPICSVRMDDAEAHAAEAHRCPECGLMVHDLADHRAQYHPVDQRIRPPPGAMFTPREP